MKKHDISLLKIDDPVIVWDEQGGDTMKAHFAGVGKDGRIKVFYGGGTSWSSKNVTTLWNFWKPAPKKRVR